MTEHTPELQAIIHRVETLETENRRLRRFGLLAVGLLGSLFLMGQGEWTPKVVFANSFILRDADGKIRAMLAFCGPWPCLKFLDVNGRTEAQLDLGTSGPRLSFSDPDGRLRTYLTVDSDGAQLFLGASGNSQRVELRATDIDAPNVGVFNGKEVVKLGASEQRGYLNFSGSGGKGQVDLEATGSTGRLMLSGGDGKTFASIEAQKEQARLGVGTAKTYTLMWAREDGASLGAGDGEGFEATLGSTDLLTPSTGETHKTSAASLVLFGKDKKVLWSAP